MESIVDGLKEDASGKYRLEGNNLVLEFTQADVQGPDERNAQKEQLKGMLLQGARVPIRWNGPASFTILLRNDPPLMVTKADPNP
jgi:hypothetical protein